MLDGEPWPRDEDFGGGDVDAYNEARRPKWAADDPAEVRAHLAASRARLLAIARTLPLEVVRSDEAWEWVFMTLHGHIVDHLPILDEAARAAAQR